MKRCILFFLTLILILTATIPSFAFATDNQQEIPSLFYDITNYPFIDTVNSPSDVLIPYTVENKGEYVGKVYRLNVTDTLTLAFDMCPVTSIEDIINIESFIFVFAKDTLEDGSVMYNLIDMYNDVSWHAPVITFDEPKEYFIYCCNKAAETVPCVLKIENATNETVLPDFRNEEVRLPENDELWQWDGQTHTLTLKDGFLLKTFSDNALNVPVDTKIIIEGSVSILSWSDIICGEGNISVELMPGAHLTLITYSEYAIYTNTGSIDISATIESNESKPTVLITSSHYGLYTGEEGSISINGCNVTMDCYETAIYNNNGTIDVDDCNLTINNSLEGIINAYDVDFVDKSTEYHTNFTNSSVSIATYGNSIKNIYGNINFDNCEVNIHADTGRGIIASVASSLCVKDGRFVVITGNEAILINDGNFVLDNTSFYLRTVDGDNIVYIKSGIICDDNIEITSNSDLSYAGKWSNDNFKSGNIVISNDASEFESAVLFRSFFQGDITFNSITGIDKDIYVDGENIDFSVSSQNPDKYINIGDTKWQAVSWSVLNTDLVGHFDDDTASFSIKELKDGSYSLNVEFVKQYYDGEEWVFYDSIDESMVCFVDITFNVDNPEPPQVGDCCTYFMPLTVILLCTTTVLIRKKYVNA